MNPFQIMNQIPTRRGRPAGVLRQPLLWALLGSWLLAASCGGGGGGGDQPPTQETRWDQFTWDEANWS